MSETAVFPAFSVRPPRKKIAKRQLELRNRLFPTVTPDWLWTRQTHNGFTTLPKAMPLMLSIMDDLAKGQPVSGTYLELWCRTFDENFVTLSKPREIAFHSGFTGQRAERTWRQRLNILSDLRFVMLSEGPQGPASYALLLNPYKVIQWHFQQPKHNSVRVDKFNALMERAAEIGDESLSPPPPAPAVAAPTAVAPAASAASVVPPVAAPASS